MKAFPSRERRLWLVALRGVQLALSEVNAKGGVLGRSVKLIEVDDQADPERAGPAAFSVYFQGAVAS
jgi:ABC-type branched-subunit amino acid transport system substrate-binding protein